MSDCRKWQPLVERCVTALRVPDGAFHLEAFLTPAGERIFLELAARPGGGPIKRTIELVHGVDILLEHLRLQLGLYPTFTTANPPASYGGWVMFPKVRSDLRAQYVTHVTLPKSECLKTVMETRVPPIGAKASGAFFCHDDNFGQFILRGESVDVLHDIHLILGSYAVQHSE